MFQVLGHDAEWLVTATDTDHSDDVLVFENAEGVDFLVKVGS